MREGETGIVVHGRSVSQISDAIVELLTDRDKAAQMGAAGRAWVEQNWHWDRQGARLRELLR